jgi:hypothetical protein
MMDGCILWTKGMDALGYGRLWVNGQCLLAHRWAWMQENGPIPEGMCVCHHCDNPSCINPGHLFLGTHQDNMSDMAAKGRSEHGEMHWSKRYPEKVQRGTDHWTNRNPGKVSRGERHSATLRGVVARGERHCRAKLTEESATFAMARLLVGESQPSVAKFFNVSRSSILAIWNGMSWGWVFSATE